MPVILRADNVKDYYESTYRIDIIDVDGEADAEPFNVGPEGVIIDYQGAIDDPHSRIITSSATVVMYVEDNAFHQAFLAALIIAREGRFYMEVYKESGLQFVGTIIVDKVTYEDMIEPFTLTLHAVDGLARLKDIPYLPHPEQPLQRRETALFHVQRALRFMELETISGTRNFLMVVPYWYESKMPNTTDNPLAMTSIEYNAFAREKGLNEYEYLSCFQVLEQIALLFNARVYHAMGVYVFEQINYRTEAFSIVFYYSHPGTFLFSLAYSNEATIGQLPTFSFSKETGGIFSHIPPVREIRLIYKFKANANYLHDRIDTWSYLGATEELVGFIDKDDVEDILFLISGALRWWSYIPTPPGAYELIAFKSRYRITLRVGDKWLIRSRTTDFFYSNDYNVAEWSSSPGYYMWETPVYPPDTGTFDNIEPFSILTPPIEEGGDVYFNFEFVELLTPDSQHIFESTYVPAYITQTRWVFQLPGLHTTLGDGNIYIPTERNFVYYGPSENSRKKVIELTIGDGPNTTNKNRVKVWDGAEWVESGAKWSPKGQTVEVSIQRLLLLEMAQLLVKPLTIMNGNVIHHALAAELTPYRVFNYQGNRYLFMSGRVATTPGDFSGSWFLMNFEEIE